MVSRFPGLAAHPVATQTSTCSCGLGAHSACPGAPRASWCARAQAERGGWTPSPLKACAGLALGRGLLHNPWGSWGGVRRLQAGATAGQDPGKAAGGAGVSVRRAVRRAAAGGRPGALGSVETPGAEASSLEGSLATLPHVGAEGLCPSWTCPHTDRSTAPGQLGSGGEGATLVLLPVLLGRVRLACPSARTPQRSPRSAHRWSPAGVPARCAGSSLASSREPSPCSPGEQRTPKCGHGSAEVPARVPLSQPAWTRAGWG